MAQGFRGMACGRYWAAEATLAQLIVQDTERTYLVDIAAGERLLVGRSHDCDLPVAASRASRKHAAFVPDGDGHRISDLDSTNGTLLNGAPFQHDTLLKDGDSVDVGGCTILYRIVPA